MAVAGSAGAQCPSSPAPLSATTSPALHRYVERYNALLAADPDLYHDDTAPGWRALAAEMTRDPAVPDGMKARADLMAAGASHKEAGIAEALATAQTALRLGEAAPADASLHAEAMTILTLKEAEAGKNTDAAAHGDRAIVENARLHGERSWAYGRALAAAALAHNGVGRYEDAERDIATAERLTAVCLAPANPYVGLMLRGHAAILGTLGRIDESLVESERALAWTNANTREEDDALPELLDSYGWTLRNAWRLRESEAVLRRSADLYAKYHPAQWANRGSATGKLANVLAAEGRYVEAEALWLKTRDYYLAARNLSNPLGGSGELRRSADTAQLRGDLPLALARRKAALDLMEARVPAQHPELLRARLEYASTLSAMHRTPEAIAIATPAIRALRTTMAEGDFKRWGAEITYARLVADTGDTAAAQAAARPPLARMEAALLDAATSRGNLVSFAPQFAAAFATGVRLALLTGQQEEAFHDLQLANLSDIVLVNADVAQRAAAANAPARALVDRLQQQTRERRQLDKDRTLAVSRHDEAVVASFQARIQTTDAAIAATSAQLDRVFPALRAIGRPVPITLAAYRARLGPDDVLLAPVGQAGGAFTIAVTRDGLSWAAAPGAPAQTADLVARIRRSIDAGRSGGRQGFDVAAARDLYRQIVPPALEPLLREHRRILYYATGKLATIPPALLLAAPPHAGAMPQWLIRTHSISIVPSLTTAVPAAGGVRTSFLGVGAPLLRASLSIAAPAMTIAAAPTRSAALAPLPGAKRELTAMAAMFPAAKDRLLIGIAATRPALRALPLADYGVIAFATHGLLNDAVPGLTQPALVLTPTKDDNGLLTAADVANLHLDADWVILSACDTASGGDAQSASYSGLTRAFMEAGARALLVSHWPVRDDAAERLTVATLRGVRQGLDRPTALQRAMLALMNDKRVPGAANPAIWAPFVVVEQ